MFGSWKPVRRRHPSAGDRMRGATTGSGVFVRSVDRDPLRGTRGGIVTEGTELGVRSSCRLSEGTLAPPSSFPKVVSPLQFWSVEHFDSPRPFKPVSTDFYLGTSVLFRNHRLNEWWCGVRCTGQDSRPWVLQRKGPHGEVYPGTPTPTVAVLTSPEGTYFTPP